MRHIASCCGAFPLAVCVSYTCPWLSFGHGCILLKLRSLLTKHTNGVWDATGGHGVLTTGHVSKSSNFNIDISGWDTSRVTDMSVSFFVFLMRFFFLWLCIITRIIARHIVLKNASRIATPYIMRHIVSWCVPLQYFYVCVSHVVSIHGYD